MLKSYTEWFAQNEESYFSPIYSVPDHQTTITSPTHTAPEAPAAAQFTSQAVKEAHDAVLDLLHEASADSQKISQKPYWPGMGDTYESVAPAGLTNRLSAIFAALDKKVSDKPAQAAAAPAAAPKAPEAPQAQAAQAAPAAEPAAAPADDAAAAQPAAPKLKWHSHLIEGAIHRLQRKALADPGVRNKLGELFQIINKGLVTPKNQAQILKSLDEIDPDMQYAARKWNRQAIRTILEEAMTGKDRPEDPSTFTKEKLSQLRKAKALDKKPDTAAAPAPKPAFKPAPFRNPFQDDHEDYLRNRHWSDVDHPMDHTVTAGTVQY